MKQEGMSIEFNGQKNIIMSDGGCEEYAIGAMMCELSRFDPKDLKELAMSVPYFQDAFDKEKLADTLMNLHSTLLERYPKIIAEMISISYINDALEYTDIETEEDRASWIDTYCGCKVEEDRIAKYILENSGYDSFGINTIGQFVLTISYAIAQEFCVYKIAFLSIAESEENEEAKERALNLLQMYSSEHFTLQHIDYHILCYDGRFNSVYTIKSMISLLLFELAHLLDKNTGMVKCKHCGQYFIPAKRSDAQYCSYPAPNANGKTCKDIGAQAAWAKKEKDDPDVPGNVYAHYSSVSRRTPA